MTEETRQHGTSSGYSNHALGFDRLITYTQAGESGTSLRAAGFRVIASRRSRPGWDRPSRRRINRDEPVQRFLWEVAA